MSEITYTQLEAAPGKGNELYTFEQPSDLPSMIFSIISNILTIEIGYRFGFIF